MKKIVLALCCLAVVVAASYGWATYQNKQRFDAVMAEYPKDQPAHR